MSGDGGETGGQFEESHRGLMHTDTFFSSSPVERISLQKPMEGLEGDASAPTGARARFNSLPGTGRQSESNSEFFSGSGQKFRNKSRGFASWHGFANEKESPEATPACLLSDQWLLPEATQEAATATNPTVSTASARANRLLSLIYGAHALLVRTWRRCEIELSDKCLVMSITFLWACFNVGLFTQGCRYVNDRFYPADNLPPDSAVVLTYIGRGFGRTLLLNGGLILLPTTRFLCDGLRLTWLNILLPLGGLRVQYRRPHRPHRH